MARPKGFRHSPETRAKQSAALKGRKGHKISDEQRVQISARFKGRKLTPEHCAKVSAALKGRTLTPYHRAKAIAQFLPYCGNGKWGQVPTEHETALHALLGDGWVLGLPVGIPGGGCYRLDLAHPGAGLVVELDGKDHRKVRPRAHDERRTKYLLAHGWRAVCRIPNKQIQERPDAIAEFLKGLAA